jgi:hypothetical protein
MGMKTLATVAALALAVVALCPGRATATVLVPMSDADLVSSSEVIVVARVGDIESLEFAGGRISTQVELLVERVLKGAPALGRVVLTESGGWGAARTVWILGAPTYTRGERALVFLRRGIDGSLRTNGLTLGKYEIASGPSGKTVVRRPGPALDRRLLADFIETVVTIDAQQGGRTGTPSPAAPVPVISPGPVVHRRALEAFTFLGNPARRWMEADTGTPVRFRLAATDPGFGAVRSRSMLDDALGAWTQVASAAIELENAGATSPAPSLVSGTCDGRSKVQFDDPLDEVPDLVNCSGVLGLGGVCSSGEVEGPGGATFSRITEGDVTLNDGLSGCFSAGDVREVLTHEIGHAIGLGHSSQNGNEPDAVLRDATMYYVAHFDGRGAEVRSDDVAGVSTLYPVEAPGGGGEPAGPDGDQDGIGDGRDNCPETPAGRVVDSTGCACDQEGSLGCDDGDACTIEHCDGTTGACVAHPIDCDDGEPCSIDSCRADVGCVNDLRGDSDGDGLCDPLDNCRLVPHADPHDLDGDGVGDACQCAERAPGRCVPARGKKGHRCLVEWRPEAAPRVRNGLPLPNLTCLDGDQACDADGVSGQCTFRVALCLNNRDPRFPRCRPSSVARLQLRSPRPAQPRDDADRANAAAVLGAIDLTEQTANLCSAPLELVVPTRGARRGSKRFKLKVVSVGGQRVTAKLKLGCAP